MPCPSCGGAGGNAPRREEKLDAPLLDLEESLPVAPPPDAVQKTGQVRAHVARCFFRGLLALLWVFLADLLRRLIVSFDDDPSLIFVINPLSLLALAVTLYLFTVMDCLEDCFPSLK